MVDRTRDISIDPDSYRLMVRRAKRIIGFHEDGYPDLTGGWAGQYAQDVQALVDEVERLRGAIRHEYREARAHRTDNRTALTRLHRIVDEPVIEDESVPRRQFKRVPATESDDR